MQKLRISVILTVLMVIGLVGVASSAMIVDLIGDKDGFGIGAASGSAFSWTAIGSGDGDGTDVWMWGDYAYTHSYDLTTITGPITYAELEIFTGGQGWYGLSEIYVDSTLIGTLTDGDGVGVGYNYAWLDSFDLLPFSSLITGAETITINTYMSGDGWCLDYSQLTISDEPAAPVPEPATILLMGSGLLGLLGYNRRRFSQER